SLQVEQRPQLADLVARFFRRTHPRAEAIFLGAPRARPVALAGLDEQVAAAPVIEAPARAVAELDVEELARDLPVHGLGSKRQRKDRARDRRGLGESHSALLLAIGASAANGKILLRASAKDIHTAVEAVARRPRRRAPRRRPDV